MSTPVGALRKALKSDARWSRFYQVYTHAYRPEFDTYIEEIQRLHSVRSTRVLGATAAPTGLKIADAAMRDQSSRSRCVEICMIIARERNHLAITMNTVQSYIEVEYNSLLQECGIKTISEKRNIIVSLFGAAQRKLDRLDTIPEIANMVIDDVDKASWTLKTLVASLEIATARERTL